MTATQAPVLETHRLILRGHCREDLDDCIGLWSDPAVTLHIGGRPLLPEEVWTRLLRYVGHWGVMGFGYWLVRDKTSGAFVGEVGFGDFCRAISPDISGIPEAGWVVSPQQRGRGYALEAVDAAHRWIESARDARSTVCMIDPANHVSQHIALRCGYQAWTQSTYRQQPVLLFRRDVPARTGGAASR